MDGPYRTAGAGDPMVPAYIRCFATTDGSAMGVLALELCKAMERIAPVRAVSMSGVLVGRWLSRADLTMTAMVGSFANVVACDPGRWTWTQRIPMPQHNAWQSAMTDSQVKGLGKVEVAEARKSLYTANVRNVLYALAVPRAQPELEAALLFESIIVPNEQHLAWWKKHTSRTPVLLPFPFDASALRAEIVGPPL